VIKSLRQRVRPDNLTNQVRSGGQTVARRVYLATIVVAGLALGHTLFGGLFFLEAPGLVSKDVHVVATDFAGVVTAVPAAAGRRVQAGDVIAVIESKDMEDRIADLSGRIGQISTREGQIASRLNALANLMPLAAHRQRRAHESFAMVRDALGRGLTTTNRVADAAREAFEAERDVTNLQAEHKALSDERAQLAQSRGELSALLASARGAYNEGRVVARVSGEVGAALVTVGAAAGRGAALAEIFHGETQVRTFAPGSRFFSLEPGQRVVVSDGAQTRLGWIERIEPVSDRLPPELQSQFRGVERHQLMRARLDEEGHPFPSPSIVRVMGLASPGGLVALASGWLKGPLRQPAVDQRAVGSVSPRPAATVRPPEWRELLDSTDARLWRPLHEAAPSTPVATAPLPPQRFTAPAAAP
jgi:multidrug resistance efflux pump